MSTAKAIVTPLLNIFKTEDRAITSLIVLVFALAAAHNYDALRHFAVASGVAPALSFFTPILIDIFIAAAVWVSLRNKRYGEPARLAWAIVILFTLASVWINLLHYPLIPGGISLAVLVPAVVFLSAELAKGLVESQRNRSGAAATTAQLTTTAAQLSARIDEQRATAAQLSAHIDEQRATAAQLAAHNAQQAAQMEAQILQQSAHLQTRIEQQRARLEAEMSAEIEARRSHLLTEISQLEAQRAGAKTGQIDPIWRECYQIDGLLAAGLNQRQAAEIVGISESTLRNRVKNLNGDSLLHKLERG